MQQSRLFIHLIFLVALQVVVYTSAFVHHPKVATTCVQKSRPTFLVSMSSDNDGDEDRLRALGYSEEELKRSARNESRKQDTSVRVDLVDDIDAVTLTAFGFGLIAFNFFVFANMGDGGIAGIVATIINTLRQ